MVKTSDESRIGMMYLSKYLIRSDFDFRQLRCRIGLFTALNREWDNATVIKIEEMWLNLDPGYTIIEYDLRWLAGIMTKCVPTLLIKLKPKNRVSNIRSAANSKLNILSFLSMIKKAIPMRLRSIPNDATVVIPYPSMKIERLFNWFELVKILRSLVSGT